jgi:AraC family transcriptional regulator of adaptative response / DNA-3-methyladenine glycosylase II
LRLINEGALDNGSTAQLADRLGLTDRHLRRLFLEHVGVPPIVVAETRRLLFAKKLITETHLAFADIAFASGYRSLRRFNEAFRDTYQRSPTELRRLRPPDGGAQSAIELKLNYRPPYDWNAFLHFVGRRAIAGLEVVRDDCYRRNGISVRHNARENCLVASIDADSVSKLRPAVEQIRFFFDLRANSGEIAAHLRKSPALKGIVARSGGLRLPGCWDPFELAVRAILGQQVTVRGASTLAARLVEQFGPPRADRLADSDLAAIGLPEARAESLRALARAVCDGSVRLDGSATGAEVIESLCAVRGIGPWTANYIAMRALGDPDVFPASDLGLLKAAGVSSPRRLEMMAEAWRPWRSYAALYLWESLREKG